MTDANEQSFSADSATDTASTPRSKSLKQHASVTSWRFRPSLQPVAMVRTIKTQIIPKIVLALRSAPVAPPEAAEEPAAPTEVEFFAALALSADEGAAFAYVVDFQAKGTSVESIFLDLLAPAARQLGAQWQSDATDFASVTLGVGRLQLIMHRLSESFVENANEGRGESALLTIIPGDQHSFGLSMVAEFFRRAGWNLCTGPFSSHQELTSLVHQHWFDIVGFSVSSDRRLDELKKDISDIRRDSRNRHVGIILGGPMITAQPDLVASMGADMMSADAISAPLQAHDLIERMKGRA